MNLISLFDADAYYTAGNCPWTFFAFPSRLADDMGIPIDDAARRLLQELLRRGIRVGTWRNSPVKDTCYFACPKEEIERVNHAVNELEELGVFEKGFCTSRTEYLFSWIDPSH